jgi:hypothetical protein
MFRYNSTVTFHRRSRSNWAENFSPLEFFLLTFSNRGIHKVFPVSKPWKLTEEKIFSRERWLEIIFVLPDYPENIFTSFYFCDFFLLFSGLIAWCILIKFFLTKGFLFIIRNFFLVEGEIFLGDFAVFLEEKMLLKYFWKNFIYLALRNEKRPFNLIIIET